MKKAKKQSKILFARELRNKSTEVEEILWQYLRDRRFFGKKFRRQHIIKGFIVDFYCFEDKVAIELDGGIHLMRKTYDDARQKAIGNNGISILRFTNDEILSSIKHVLRAIKQRLSFPSPATLEREVKIAKSNLKPG
jgi:very-short-patch-repair endonuclease